MDRALDCEYTFYGLLSLGSLVFLAGLFALLYLSFYKYPKGFRDARVVELLEDPKASPVRGTPVALRGRVIGRGAPGLFFSEDIKLDDGTGLILLDYNQVLPLINFFVGVFKTEGWLGRDVEVTGWYRRRVVPYVELYEMRVGEEAHHLWTAGVQKAGCAALIAIGVLILLLSAVVLL